MRIMWELKVSINKGGKPSRICLVNGKWVSVFAPGATRVRRENYLAQLHMLDQSRINALEDALKQAVKRHYPPVKP